MLLITKIVDQPSCSHLSSSSLSNHILLQTSQSIESDPSSHSPIISSPFHHCFTHHRPGDSYTSHINHYANSFQIEPFDPNHPSPTHLYSLESGSSSFHSSGGNHKHHGSHRHPSHNHTHHHGKAKLYRSTSFPSR